ncbi:cardiolipin synthase ClsB [Ramlibacter rhizophilus]|uniref:Cardiolipin synthase B n=1 Tax=Ramlibacter rhizophilus TaxID=1781167 RepID=A0A4Z0BSM5_9BURK|nr:cardiolipin synthase ClsB [Ramlibacter rhizophilus]TFZ01464.1 cardiolipin synthase ClsB [Ramlibacter rhizophilus]
MSLRLPPLRPGHRIALLEGSAELFPALVAAVDAATHEVWLETYIFDFTSASAEVAWALERAARRGVAVRVVVDGFGTPELPAHWRERFDAAGVRWLVYAPLGSLGVAWPGSWRRLHRKLCVVDARLAFCGGINLLDDWHDPNHGALESPRLDFAVQVSGPVVADVRHAMHQLWQRLRAVRQLDPHLLSEVLASPPPLAAQPRWRDDAGAPAQAKVALLLRDNLRHRRHIEKSYLRAIGRAQREIIIANAYFVPGGRLRRALIRAARRGVRVMLLLQGRYEYFMQYYASRPVYDALLRAGVEIHEYSRSFLHAKVAVFDRRVATVGSSNLDPLSLLLAREANMMVEDGAFAECLRLRLLHAIEHQGVAMDPAQYARRPWRERGLEYLALGVMRLALVVQGKKYL